MDLEKGRGLLERTGTDDGGKDRGGGWVGGRGGSLGFHS